MKPFFIIIALLISILYCYEVTDLTDQNFDSAIAEQGFHKYVRFYTNRVKSIKLDDIQRRVKETPLSEKLKVYRVNCITYSDLCKSKTHFTKYPFIATYDIFGQHSNIIQEHNSNYPSETQSQTQTITSKINRNGNIFSGISWESIMISCVTLCIILIVGFGIFSTISLFFKTVIKIKQPKNIAKYKYFSTPTNPLMKHRPQAKLE